MFAPVVNRLHVYDVAVTAATRAYMDAIMALPEVIDNLRAAVTQADWFDPELNPKIASFAEHYETVILPTRPAMPRHKGKIEAGVKYGQNNALKGRSFTSLAEQNLFLSDWERTVADTRIHGTTRQQVIKVFNEVERAKLLPLPPACSRFLKKRRAASTGTATLRSNGPITRCPRSMSDGRSGCAGSPDWSAFSTSVGNKSPCTHWPNRANLPPTRSTSIHRIGMSFNTIWITCWIGPG